MRKSESCQVASDNASFGAMCDNLLARRSTWLPCSLDTVPGAPGTVRHPGMQLPFWPSAADGKLRYLQHLAP